MWIPLENALFALVRSIRSTPIQAKSEQLSGPEIPGIQIKEEGNLRFTESRDFINKLSLLTSCMESTKQIIEGSTSKLVSVGSWKRDCAVMGRKALPRGKIPASDSIRLGGRERPSLASHKTWSSNGGHKLARVFIFSSAGALLESLNIRKGASATPIESSSSIKTIEGV